MTERRNDEKTVLRQKKAERQRDRKMMRQETVLQMCEVDFYTICVEIYFERKYTVYKFESTLTWTHMSCIKIDLSILNNI